jgi:hypothetical protein
MDDQLRAMALSLAVEWSKSQDASDGGPSPEEVIEAAKKFVRYVEGNGISTVAPNLFPGGH